MSADSIDQWLVRLETLIRGLDLVEPGTLPESFTRDILEPLRAEEGMAGRLRMRIKAFELIRNLPALRHEATGRVWFFWENICRQLAGFVRAESCIAWRMGPARVLFRIHPLSPEEQVEEGEWPKSEKGVLTASQQEGLCQSWLLRLGLYEDYPIVFQFQTRAPSPRINQLALKELAHFCDLLNQECQPFVPERARTRPPLIDFGPKSQHVVECMGDNSEEGADWEIIKTGEIYGSDPSLLAALKAAEHAAQSDATVFFMGESGTGKELFAQHLHNLSSFHNGPFIPINCSAVPRELIESEMFGHEKGSFTGAYYRKIGKVEQAHGGTLFLDEIGEMPLDFQAKLLRYLQEKKFCRVGGNKAIFSDARVVVATHRDLLEMVAAKTFREDLYYRIHVIPIEIPPLRQRGRDVRKLARIFFQKFIGKSRASRRQVDERVFEVLERYPFPGNVRELENVIHRTVVMTQKPVIEVDDLPGEIFKDQSRIPREDFRLHPFEVFDHIVPESRDAIRDLRREVEQVAISYHRDLERRFMLQALDNAGGSARKAAKMIDVNRTLFYKLLRRSGINISLLTEEGNNGNEE